MDDIIKNIRNLKVLIRKSQILKTFDFCIESYTCVEIRDYNKSNIIKYKRQNEVSPNVLLDGGT